MLIGEWIGLVTLIATNAGISIGIYKHFDGRIEKSNANVDTKIARVFQRFDEYKTETENKYVKKDLCKVMHDNNSDNLSGLETRIEKRFDKLDEQVAKLLEK